MMRWLDIVLVGTLAALAVPAHAQQDAIADRETAQAAYANGDFDQAKAILGHLLRERPDDPDLLRRMAAVEAAMGDLAAAQDTIDRAASLAPQDADIQLARANILFWNGRRDEARVSAEGIRRRHGDYPGLAALERNIARQQRDAALRVQSISVGQSVSRASFESGDTQDWGVTRASLAAGWAASSTAVIEIEREDRTAVDTRVSARVDLPAGPHRVFLAGSATPDADFRENWSVAAGADVQVGARTQLLGDVRFAEYRLEDVTVAGAGIRHYLSDKFVLTGRSIHLFGGGEDYRLGGSIRADYLPANGPSYFAILASYPDAEVDGTRQLRAIAGGVKIDFARHYALRLSAEYESREDSYDRLGFGASLSWLFGQQ